MDKAVNLDKSLIYRYGVGDQCISKQPCFVFFMVATGGALAITQFNLDNSQIPTIYPSIKYYTPKKQSKIIVLKRPVFFSKGLYADCASNGQIFNVGYKTLV
jgi:hypothetical protein